MPFLSPWPRSCSRSHTCPRLWSPKHLHPGSPPIRSRECRSALRKCPRPAGYPPAPPALPAWSLPHVLPAPALLPPSPHYYSLDYLHPKSPFLPRLVESTDVSSQAENPSLSLHLHFLCYHTFVTRLKKQEPQPSKVKLLPSSIRGLRRFITCL